MECCLAKGELIRLDGGKGGLLVHCFDGAIWLTSGDGVDYLIRAGKCFEIPANQIAVVEALESAEFRLEALSVMIITSPISIPSN